MMPTIKIIRTVSTISMILFSFASPFASFPSAHADGSVRTTVEMAVGRRNIVVQLPDSDQRTLLHLTVGCGDLAVGQSVNVVFHDAIDGGTGDKLQISPTLQCNIDLAEPITQPLAVTINPAITTQAQVATEDGKNYAIRYGADCSEMPQFRDSFVFIQQQNSEPSVGDRLILPEKLGICSVTGVDDLSIPLSPTPSTPKPTGDLQAPSDVTNFKAVPGNGRVYLQWRAAKDNVGVDHYLISVSTTKINDLKLDAETMPDVRTATGINSTILELENRQTIYFYIVAMDKAGNRSGSWAEAHTTPLDSIPVPSTTSPLGLKLHSQTEKTFLIRWNRIPGTLRQMITFDVDGKREFGNSRYTKTSILIRKSEERKGKPLKFTVRAIGVKGVMEEKTLELKF